MLLAAILAIHLAQFTLPNGQKIEVNPNEVSSVREPQGEGHFAKGTRCILVMTNGKLIAVQEECDAVRIAVESDR